MNGVVAGCTVDKDIKPGRWTACSGGAPLLELFRSRETGSDIGVHVRESARGWLRKKPSEAWKRFLDRNCGVTFKLLYSGKIVVHRRGTIACNLMARNLWNGSHWASNDPTLSHTPPWTPRHFTFTLNWISIPWSRSFITRILPSSPRRYDTIEKRRNESRDRLSSGREQRSFSVSQRGRNERRRTLRHRGNNARTLRTDLRLVDDEAYRASLNTKQRVSRTRD